MNGTNKWIIGVGAALIVGLLAWNFSTVQALQVTVGQLTWTVASLTQIQQKQTEALEKANEILNDIRVHLGVQKK